METHSRVEASVKLVWRLISDNDLDAAVDRIVDSNYETKIKYYYGIFKADSRQKKEEVDKWQKTS